MLLTDLEKGLAEALASFEIIDCHEHLNRRTPTSFYDHFLPLSIRNTAYKYNLSAGLQRIHLLGLHLRTPWRRLRSVLARFRYMRLVSGESFHHSAPACLATSVTCCLGFRE